MYKLLVLVFGFCVSPVDLKPFQEINQKVCKINNTKSNHKRKLEKIYQCILLNNQIPCNTLEAVFDEVSKQLDLNDITVIYNHLLQVPEMIQSHRNLVYCIEGVIAEILDWYRPGKMNNMVAVKRNTEALEALCGAFPLYDESECKILAQILSKRVKSYRKVYDSTKEQYYNDIIYIILDNIGKYIPDSNIFAINKYMNFKKKQQQEIKDLEQTTTSEGKIKYLHQPFRYMIIKMHIINIFGTTLKDTALLRRFAVILEGWTENCWLQFEAHVNEESIDEVFQSVPEDKRINKVCNQIPLSYKSFVDTIYSLIKVYRDPTDHNNIFTIAPDQYFHVVITHNTIAIRKINYEPSSN